MASPSDQQSSGRQIWQPSYRNLYRLQNLIKEHNLPEAVKIEVDACLANLEVRVKYS